MNKRIKVLTHSNKYELGFFDDLEEWIMPEGIEVVDIGCFNFSDIKKIVCAKSLKSIEEEAFQNCKNLINIDFNNSYSLHNIGERAFKNCEELEYIELPYNLEILRKETFDYCYKLKEVKANKNLKEVEAGWREHSGRFVRFAIPASVEKISGVSLLEDDYSTITIDPEDESWLYCTKNYQKVCEKLQ